MKGIWQIGIGFLCAVALIFGGLGEGTAISADPTAKITLRFSHAYPTGYIRHKSAVLWKELLEKESKGQVEVKIYPAGQLVKSTEEMNALMMGSVDMAATHGGPISSITPLWDIFIMPFFWPNDGKNFEPAWKFKQSPIVKKILISKLEAKGIKFIGFNTVVGGSGEFSTSKKPVKNISDFKGLKMHTAAGWMRYEAVKALGASCVTLSSTEIGQAIAQGTLDGEFGTYTNVLASGYPVKYVHWWPSWVNDTGAAFLMNAKKWNSLPENIKKLIENVVTPQMQEWTNKEVIAEEIRALTELEKRGIQVISDPEIQKEAAKKLEFLGELFENKFGPEGRELIAGAKTLLGTK